MALARGSLFTFFFYRAKGAVQFVMVAIDITLFLLRVFFEIRNYKIGENLL